MECSYNLTLSKFLRETIAIDEIQDQIHEKKDIHCSRQKYQLLRIYLKIQYPKSNKEN